MRGGLLAVVMLVGGCFSPRVPSYIPCAAVATAAERCPAGQVCVGSAAGDVCVPTSEADIDAPPGPSDAPVDARIDAVDAALDAPPDVLSWVAIEMLTIPADGTVITSATLLAAGTSYRVRATGTFVVNSVAGTLADAEYLDFNAPQDSAGGVDQGLGINDAIVDDNLLPNWGAYTASHVYELPWTGTGAAIRAQIHDGIYTNNTGSLTLTILALQ